MIKAIIFDFDGVIHDTFMLAYKIHKKLNPTHTKDNFRSYFDGNLFKKVNTNFDQKAHDAFRKLEFQAFKDLKLEKQIRNELTKLSKQFDLFIISSNSIRNLNMYLENNEFTHIFKEVLAAETHKSKIEKFKIVFKKYNLNSKSCIFVTDTLGDILEANKVSVKSIACTFGYHDEQRLKKGKPFRIISNFKEIRKIIESMR